MKIIEYITQLGSGGAERFTVDMCNELSKHHEVILCLSYSLKDYGFFKDEINPNVRVVSFDKKKGVSLTLPFRIFKFIKKEKPDIVHTHLSAIIYTAFSALFCKKVKFFHTIHSVANEEAKGLIGEKVRRFLFKRKFITPVTISKSSLGSFRGFYNMDASLVNNGRDIPRVIDVSENVKKEFEKYRETPETKVLVHLAHVGYPKQQDVMAKVADRLIKEGYKLEILFIGRLCEQNMADFIESLGNKHLHLLGTRTNPLEYLKMADAFCLTSSHEGLPISLIEALGVGTIPVCTPVGGIVDLVQDGVNGFLSKGIDEDAYYAALKRYLDTPAEKLEKMRTEAIKSYEPYNMRECAKNYEKLFVETIAG